MSVALKSALVIATLFLAACSTGHCRRDGTKINKKNIKPPAGYTEEDLGNVRVSKSDGGLQCGLRGGMSLTDMQEQLKGIKVAASEKKHDGLMRVQSCGASTGMLNVYEIRQQDLSKAQGYGFTLIRSLVKKQ